MNEPIDRWTQYFFEAHSEATLRQWAKRLSMFRFVRAFGGHANDGDSIDVVFTYNTTDELLRFFDHLGLALRTHAERPPQPEPGKSYPMHEYDAFPSLIPNTKWIEQPRHCTISGQPVFAWCYGGKIKLSLGANWQVNESHVVIAEVLERVLKSAPLPWVDPPVDHKRCVCPKYHPDYF